MGEAVGTSYLFLHAHPDDETLSSGAIIGALTLQGHRCLVLTATRGEMGQAREGSLSLGEDLVEARMRERTEALGCLRATDAGWLGEPPNRAADKLPRIYRDSGMKWVTSTVAGPSPDASPDSLCRADLEEIVADLLAAANHHQAEVLVSYDAAGGYGHPDHVRCHLAAAKAATILQIPLCEFTEQRAEASQWFDVSDQPGGVVAAYRAYHTQLSVQGDAITHVGGQIDYVRYAGGLRWVRT